MKNKVLLFLLVISLPAMAQDSLKTCHHHDNSMPFFTMGVDNSQFESVNLFLKNEGFTGSFQPIAFSYGVGFSSPHKNSLIELYINGSAQHFNSLSKRIGIQNNTLQLLYHYCFLNKGLLRSSVYSGINWHFIYLNIDSIYKPANIGNFSSVNATKNMFDIPLGIQFLHHFALNKKNRGRDSGLRFGLRAAYHFTVYQGDWNIGVRQQNKYSYTLSNTNYWEACMMLGVY